MYVNTDLKYRPQSLAAFVFPNDEVREIVNAYASGEMIRPLILCGTNGTGKSLLAELIPNEIEGRVAQVERVRASELDSNKAVFAKFSRNKMFDKFFKANNQRFNYNIIEEVNFDPRARNAFRVVLDDHRGTDLTIMTTNDVARMDIGVRSRSEIVEVPPCPPDRFLPRAKHIINSEGLTINEDALRATLEAVYDLAHDNRAYYRKLDEMLRSAPAMPAKQAQRSSVQVGATVS